MQKVRNPFKYIRKYDFIDLNKVLRGVSFNYVGPVHNKSASRVMSGQDMSWNRGVRIILKCKLIDILSGK